MPKQNRPFTPLVGTPQVVGVSAPLAGPRIIFQSGQVTLTWTDGEQPFQVQSKVTLDAPWVNVGPPTMRHDSTFPVTDSMGFFRVVEAYPMLTVTMNTDGTAHLEWIVPILE